MNLPSLADFGLDEKALLVEMACETMAKLLAAEKTIERMKAERLILDRRIRNQRKAWRDTWETIEMRAGHKTMPKEVRSKMLAAWCACSRERDELRRVVSTLRTTTEPE